MKKLLLLAIFSLLILPANSQSKYEKQSNEIIELFDSIKSNFTEKRLFLADFFCQNKNNQSCRTPQYRKR